MIIGMKNHPPLVSVVMSVRNAQDTLRNTISSVVGQHDVDIELIIVNDGSTDDTSRVISEESSKDKRIKVIEHENKGLTRSLIEGCKRAKGEFIARQDANDISLQGRFASQVDALTKNTDSSFCSTYVRLVTKEGAQALVAGHNGVIHGSVMMKKNAYNQSGGYRESFYYAQDIDLWSRLEEVGKHIVVPEILYEGLLFTGSISGTRKAEQEKFRNIVKKAAKARMMGIDDEALLDQAEKLSMECRKRKISNSELASGAYFIGACLKEQYPLIAKKYFKEALEYNRFHLRSRLRLFKDG